MVRSHQDALSIHPGRADDVLDWLLHQHLGRTHRCKVLRDFPLCIRLVRSVPWGGELVSRARCLARGSESTSKTNPRLGNNLAGQYKRGVGMALHIGIGNFSGAIASNIYLSRDAPRYIMGRTSFELLALPLAMSHIPLCRCIGTDVRWDRPDIRPSHYAHIQIHQCKARRIATGGFREGRAA